MRNEGEYMYGITGQGVAHRPSLRETQTKVPGTLSKGKRQASLPAGCPEGCEAVGCQDRVGA